MNISAGDLVPYSVPHSIPAKVLGPKWQNAASSSLWYLYWASFGVALSEVGTVVFLEVKLPTPTVASIPAMVAALTGITYVFFIYYFIIIFT